jgi:hypothetical protein
LLCGFPILPEGSRRQLVRVSFIVQLSLRFHRRRRRRTVANGAVGILEEPFEAYSALRPAISSALESVLMEAALDGRIEMPGLMSTRSSGFFARVVQTGVSPSTTRRVRVIDVIRRRVEPVRHRKASLGP